MGPRIVVAKRGEYGAALFTAEDNFAIPGLLIEEVADPTGAGDSFAGGFLGYLDSRRRRRSPTATTCAGRWSSAPSWPPSTSRTSAPSASAPLEPTRSRPASRDFKSLTHFSEAPLAG